MKIALSSEGENLSSPLDSRFGRAVNFIIYETDDDSFTVKSNEQNLNADQGAGIQAAQNVVKEGVSAVITGHAGPKAFQVLLESGVNVYCSGPATVQEAIDAFKAGRLEKIDAANAKGHSA